MLRKCRTKYSPINVCTQDKSKSTHNLSTDLELRLGQTAPSMLVSGATEKLKEKGASTILMVTSSWANFKTIRLTASVSMYTRMDKCMMESGSKTCNTETVQN